IALNSGNVLDVDRGISQSMNRIANTEANVKYSFRYDFSGNSYGVGLAGGATYCATCAYHVTIAVANPDGGPVTLTDAAGNVLSSTGILTQVFQDASPGI